MKFQVYCNEHSSIDSNSNLENIEKIENKEGIDLDQLKKISFNFIRQKISTITNYTSIRKKDSLDSLEEESGVKNHSQSKIQGKAKTNYKRHDFSTNRKFHLPKKSPRKLPFKSNQRNVFHRKIHKHSSRPLSSSLKSDSSENSHQNSQRKFYPKKRSSPDFLQDFIRKTKIKPLLPKIPEFPFCDSSEIPIEISFYPRESDENKDDQQEKWWKLIDHLYFRNLDFVDRCSLEKHFSGILNEYDCEYGYGEGNFPEGFFGLMKGMKEMKGMEKGDENGNKEEDQSLSDLSQLLTAMEERKGLSGHWILDLKKKIFDEEDELKPLERISRLKKDSEEIWNFVLHSSVLTNLTRGIILKSELGLLPLQRKLRDGFFETDCFVCFSSTTSLNNPIVYCGQCASSFHQICYGLSEIPEGMFVCENCRSGRKKNKKCEICTLDEFPMKKMRGSWIHITCGLLRGSIKIVDGGIVRDDRNLGKIRLSWNSNSNGNCQVCSKSTGFKYSCECGAQVHFLCAYISGWHIVISKKDSAQNQELSVSIFCPLHSTKVHYLFLILVQYAN